MRGLDAQSVLSTAVERRESGAEAPLNEYVTVLVEGVTSNRERIDELISTYSMGWTLDRMPAVDRSLLRIGAYEVLWRDDVPDAVAIAEIVALAQDLSTDESPTFINGLLARLSEVKARLQITPSA